jgi:hypothetical protein
MYTRVAIRSVEWLTELPAIDTRRPGQQGVKGSPHGHVCRTSAHPPVAAGNVAPARTSESCQNQTDELQQRAAATGCLVELTSPTVNSVTPFRSTGGGADSCTAANTHADALLLGMSLASARATNRRCCCRSKSRFWKSSMRAAIRSISVATV